MCKYNNRYAYYKCKIICKYRLCKDFNLLFIVRKYIMFSYHSTYINQILLFNF